MERMAAIMATLRKINDKNIGGLQLEYTEDYLSGCAQLQTVRRQPSICHKPMPSSMFWKAAHGHVCVLRGRNSK